MQSNLEMLYEDFVKETSGVEPEKLFSVLEEKFALDEVETKQLVTVATIVAVRRMKRIPILFRQRKLEENVSMVLEGVLFGIYLANNSYFNWPGNS